jgi:hypothetical protein
MYGTACEINLKIQGLLDVGRSLRKRKMSCVEEVWWILVELPKTPTVVGLQGLIEKAEDVLMDEEVKVDTCGTT